MSIRPIYVIAHRVLTVKGVDDAIAHGANALEIDLTAWKKGWWADNDGLLTSAGDSAQRMFEKIVAADTHKRITFVWLDIKNPDYQGDPNNHSSIERLRIYARDILQKNGIRCLYGFYKTVGGRAWDIISTDLNQYEAVCISGDTNKVLSDYRHHGAGVPVKKRMMDYGFFNLPFQFVNAKTELIRGSAEVANGNIANTFGWTTTHGHKSYVDQLLGEARVSGLICGFKATHYYDHKNTRSAARDIIDWVAAHSDTCKLASRTDELW